MATAQEVEKLAAQVPKSDGFLIFEKRDGGMRLLAECKAAAGGGGRLLILCPSDDDDSVCKTELCPIGCA